MIARLLRPLELLYIARRVKRLQADIDWLNKYEACANQPCYDTYCKVSHITQERDDLVTIAADIRRGMS